MSSYKVDFSSISKPTSLGNWWYTTTVFKRQENAPVSFFMEDAGNINDPRAVSTPYPLKLFTAKSSSGYEDSTQLLLPSAPKMYFQLGAITNFDINKDGFYDIIPFDESEYGTGPNFRGAPQFLLLSDTDGRYREVALTNALVTTHNMSAADLNHDGNLEILATNIGGSNPNSLIWSINKEGVVNEYPISGEIIRSDTYNQNGNRDIYFYSGISDLNRDKSPDLVFFSPWNQKSYTDAQGNYLPEISNRSIIYWNDGNGNFSVDRSTKIPVEKYLEKAQQIYYMAVQKVSFNDFNSDGHMDMLLSYMAMPKANDDPVAGVGQAYGILINDGKGNFIESTREWFGNDEFNFTNISGRFGQNESRIQVGDFNGSGLPSLFARTWYFDSKGIMQEKCIVYLNTGKSFSPVEITELNSATYLPYEQNWAPLSLALTSTSTVDPYEKGNLVLYSMNNVEGHPDKGTIYKITVSNLPTRFRVSNENIATDINGVAGKAYRIYKAAFDRTPDTGGLGYWIAQMDKGMDVVEVAARFIDSPEFRSLYGTNPSNAEFLTKVYSNVLDRTPDEAGLAWWVNEMKTNPAKSWQKVLADFSESTENQANVASLIANGIAYDSWS
jgi:Domain of unknown function (DUF4214)/FG-GAP-like repeat